jgi:membrane protein YdbS with pleckstrin-like domain
MLHTAGTDQTVVTLPGITRATAEEIRDSIRERIGSAA